MMASINLLVTVVLFVGLIQPVRSASISYWLAASGTNGDGLSPSTPFTDASLAIQAINNAFTAGSATNITLYLYSGEHMWPGDPCCSVTGGLSLTITTALSPPPSMDNLPILNCQTQRCIDISDPSSFQFHISYVRITNSFSGGGAISLADQGMHVMSAVLDHVVFDHCNNETATRGALEAQIGPVTVTNSIFSNNVASDGAAMYISGGTITIDKTTIDSNIANNRAAVYVFDTQSVTITDSVISNNAGDTASGLYIDAFFLPIITVTISRSIFKGNMFGTTIYIPNSQIVTTINQGTQIVLNNFGLTVNDNSNTTISPDSIVWGNSDDIICSGATNVTLTRTPPVELCPVIAACTAQGKRLDRCYTCGGSDSCVGCDGVLNSGNTTCSRGSYLGNLPNFDTIVEHTGTNPSPTLFAKDRQGNTNAEFSLFVDFVTLQEVRPDKSVVVSYNLSTIPFYVDVNTFLLPSNLTAGEVSFNYYFSDTPETSVIIRQTYYPSRQNFTLGPVEFFVDPQFLKITLEISDWPFEGNVTSENSLELKVRIRTGQAKSADQTVTTPLSGTFGIQQTDFATADTFGGWNFLNFASFRRSNGTLTTELIDLIPLANESDATSEAYVFGFRGYNSYLLYDPDFGVTLATSDSGDGGDDQKLGLIIGLSVGLPIAFVVVLTVIVVGTIVGIISKKRMRAKLFGALADNSL